MSPFLPKPITKKEKESYKGNGMVVGLASMQGWRESMEDAHMVEMQLKQEPSVSAFGVFDGHGGSLIAKAVEEHLLDEVVSMEEFQDGQSPTGIGKAICKGFLKTDKLLSEKPSIRGLAEEIGSTGVLVFITPTHVVSGNVGDTRCIISSNGIVSELSRDHKPKDEDEKKRIVDAGGTVFRNRVCGGVAVSRSFGDYWFKRDTTRPAVKQQLSAEPCVSIHQRGPKDEFVFLACDGIYDVMSNEQVQSFVKDKLSHGETEPEKICEVLLDECLAKGSRDNMSAILILFDNVSL